jgi:uncharacterized protein (DUF488 family)
LPDALYTIGHSNQSLEAFVALLKRHAIEAVADVRSWPVCRYTPYFNGEALKESLPAAGIRYVFLGTELGARRTEAETFVDGIARYDLIAKTPLFRSGLERVRRGTQSYRLALMCAEKDPLTCHRTILICRNLRDTVGSILHILDDGQLETHAEAESRLLSLCGLPEGDLFTSRAELIEQAYDMHGERIAFAAPPEETEAVS